ncbi:MAG: SsrA-binding protein SmpB [Candidatus Omnitrophica bacterium]|nr:SsrA-binding protein SmpB [Candidatus Omnitrophota bacterium]
MSEKNIATNRQARYNYTIFESLEAGIELKGTEVKSLRSGKTSMSESFAHPDGKEIFVYNIHISPYEFGNRANVDPKRKRKLLLHRAQIRSLIARVSQKGFTLVPLSIYFKGGIAKVEIAVVKGKQHFDKREAIKKKDARREISRAIKDKGQPS